MGVRPVDGDESWRISGAGSENLTLFLDRVLLGVLTAGAAITAGCRCPGVDELLVLLDRRGVRRRGALRSSIMRP
jgi:hypothetical protein